MRIGIDACCWSNRRGFGRFTRELVTQMVTLYSNHEFVLVLDAQSAGTGVFPPKATIKTAATREQPTRAACAGGARSLPDLFRLSRAMTATRPDVVFFPAVYSYYPVLGSAPKAVTIHDAIPERHPRLVFNSVRSRLFWDAKLQLALRLCDQILTVSTDARDSIAKAFCMPQQSIAVVPEGPASCFRLLDDDGFASETRRRYGLSVDVPLMVYVGGCSPHKNLDGLLHALGHLRERMGDRWQLAIVGDVAGDSFHTCHAQLLELRVRLRLERHVVFTGFVPDEDLVRLYNCATLLVLPSFDEGFGLPAVEAMACGLPVACSRRGSLGEVVGDAGAWFDPTDHHEIAGVIARLLSDVHERTKLRSAGLERVKQFSWQESARRVVKLLERLGASDKRAA